MSAITIILAILSALALAIRILAAIDDGKRRQRLGPMKLGATSSESFVNTEERGTSPWGGAHRAGHASPRGQAARPSAARPGNPPLLGLRASVNNGIRP
jgi:hypothetical protein